MPSPQIDKSELGKSGCTKAILTDSQFLAPFAVLLAGIVLLIALH